MVERTVTQRRTLNVVALFAGIGGIELGLHEAGHRTLLMCENDMGAQKVLEERFSGIPLHDDVCTLTELPTNADLLTAGFPCQDLSQAGKTAGIGGSRSGLVLEVFRLLDNRRVPWVLLENVPFMLSLGKGRAMDIIVTEMERLGYKWAYRTVDSRAFGLPQRRERVLFLASMQEDPRSVLFADQVPVSEPAVSDQTACGFYWTEGTRGLGWAVDAIPTLKGGSAIGIPSPPAIVLPSGLIVKPDLRDAERLQGFPANWTLPAESVARRGHRWRLVGNAVTVDVAKWVGERLAQNERLQPTHSERGPVASGRSWPKAAWNIGEGRYEAEISPWPVAFDRVPLTEFLQFPGEPLSLKATAGFFSRAKASTLRFPGGFLDAVESHLNKCIREANAKQRLKAA